MTPIAASPGALRPEAIACPHITVYLDQYFRRSESDEAAIRAVVAETIPLCDILDAQLASGAFLCGERFTMADIPAGVLVHRWVTWTPEELRPSHPNLQAWYARLLERPAYAEHVVDATNRRT